MDSRTEKDLRKLEQEVEAQKATFDKQASQLLTYTKTAYFTTSTNSVTLTPISDPSQAYTTEGNERVVVTFAAEGGSNTLAVLEVDSDNDDEVDFTINRVPYSGGARWIVSAVPRYNQSFTRIDTHYTFKVHSVMDGTLEAKMIWE